MPAYTCTSVACRAEPGPQLEAFRALQTVLNRFAQTASFAPLPVDGVLTDQTLTSATAVAVLFGLTPPSSLDELAAKANVWVATLSAETITPEALNADQPLPVEVTGVIEQIVQTCRRDTDGPACTQARAMCRYARGANLGQLPQLAALCAAPDLGPSRWLVAGLIVAAAGGAGFAIWHRQRRRPARIKKRGLAGPRWWIEKPASPRRCFTSKAEALRAFWRANYDIIESRGLDVPTLAEDFDAINYKYSLKGKRAVRTIADAIWEAMPKGRPYCLDRIDLDALNDMSMIRHDPDVRRFQLPDTVLEAMREDEFKKFYADEIKAHRAQVAEDKRRRKMERINRRTQHENAQAARRAARYARQAKKPRQRRQPQAQAQQLDPIPF